MEYYNENGRSRNTVADHRIQGNHSIDMIKWYHFAHVGTLTSIIDLNKSFYFVWKKFPNKNDAPKYHQLNLKLKFRTDKAHANLVTKIYKDRTIGTFTITLSNKFIPTSMKSMCSHVCSVRSMKNKKYRLKFKLNAAHIEEISANYVQNLQRNQFIQFLYYLLLCKAQMITIIIIIIARKINTNLLSPRWNDFQLHWALILA